MLHRRLVATFAALSALVAPAAAQAATAPVITGPTPASAATGKPVFTWTLGPAGETVTWITISPKNELESDGDLAFASGGEYLSSLDKLTSAWPDRAMYAGLYYWNASWRTAEDATTYESGKTPVLSFTIPAYVKSLRGTYTQYGSIPDFSAKGSFISNAKAVAVTCAVYNGKKRVTSTAYTNAYVYADGQRSAFYCSNMKVPEKLDGKRLKLVVVARGSGKSATAVKIFRAT